MTAAQWTTSAARGRRCSRTPESRCESCTTCGGARYATRSAAGVDRDTVKKMSGHLTDHVFCRYNIQAMDDLWIAAEKIEQGAAQIRATATKTATEREAPTESGRMLQ